MTDSPLQDRHLAFLWPNVPAEGETLSRHGNAKDPDYRIDSETGCWIWLKFKLRGYGRTSYKGVSRWAHRVYYELAFGPILDGADLHHRCGTPSCVNPAHLEPTTRSAHLAMHKQDASSLNWDDVRAIREAVKAGVRQQELRLRYGIAQPTLSDIVTNTTWKDPSYGPGREASCKECGEAFVATRANQRFCTQAHQKRWNNRRRYQMLRSAA